MEQKQLGSYIIEMDKLIGTGSQGFVYTCYHYKTPEVKLAVKVVEKQAWERNRIKTMELKREIQLLKTLKSDFICNMVDLSRTTNNIYIFLRFCNQGDLRGLIKQHKDNILDECQALEIIAQVVEGYKCLYENNIVHRDIKPENILLDNGKALLSDFGLGRKLETDDRMTAVGTPNYRSPQLLKEGRQIVEATNKCDVWSLGIVLYEIIEGHRPWSGQTLTEFEKNVRSKPLQFSERTSKPIQEMISKMLQIEESDRINWEQIFQHPLIIAQKDKI